MRGIVRVILRRRQLVAGSERSAPPSVLQVAGIRQRRLIVLEPQDRKVTGLCQEYVVVLLAYCNHEWVRS